VTGSLVIVGTGMGAAQLTAQARAAIEAADEVLYLIPDPVSVHAVERLNPRSRSLAHCYVEGQHRRDAYARMVETILGSVRAGNSVCAAFYGHPGVFVLPSHDAVKQARREGFDATMLPGISAEDCLFADLGVDPAEAGCQSYEATRFLERRPAIEPRAALVLWQIGVVGSANHSAEPVAPRLAELVERLREFYPDEHDVVVYEASSYVGVAPLIRPTRLTDLAAAVTPASTLYVPPVEQP
jgi:precorrin-3B methylase